MLFITKRMIPILQRLLPITTRSIIFGMSFFLFAFFFSVFCTLPSYADPTYSIKLLNTPAGYFRPRVTSVNNNGDIVFSAGSDITNRKLFSYKYSSSIFTEISVAIGWAANRTRILDNGTIIGGTCIGETPCTNALFKRTGNTTQLIQITAESTDIPNYSINDFSVNSAGEIAVFGTNGADIYYIHIIHSDLSISKIAEWSRDKTDPGYFRNFTNAGHVIFSNKILETASGSFVDYDLGINYSEMTPLASSDNSIVIIEYLKNNGGSMDEGWGFYEATKASFTNQDPEQRLVSPSGYFVNASKVVAGLCSININGVLYQNFLKEELGNMNIFSLSDTGFLAGSDITSDDDSSPSLFIAKLNSQAYNIQSITPLLLDN